VWYAQVHVKKSKVEDGGKHAYARTASNIQGGLETLIQKSDQLKADVNASKAGVQQYEEVIFRLEERKAFLQKRIDKNKRWTDVYDTVSACLPPAPCRTVARGCSARQSSQAGHAPCCLLSAVCVGRRRTSGRSRAST
jgi:hypothetical protein